ncbi:sigma-70 family RNA polymerase sigma factor [Pseudoalteromonas sp. MMG010]|uniref:sigma-70 family RNA polymerase sigma factor n=1 Tax=Pseudoalteromonas sp. MMG010 TaxID=2822685 RepID=UPI001B3A36AE|nr:sigma-70 family RNA polymerase sigma factor [Pseudoalteromonas sp. MMG010]MBQ4832108.1 sigma-70 family RNA polymerase sigma factor [Pseudoalteromonas sp. MMG010]
MNNLADEILMQHYIQGDMNAFNVLYMRHKNSLYRYFTRQCASVALAEELFQQVWVKLINARHRYKVSSKFSTYLYHIAHNELVDYYRRQSTENKVMQSSSAQLIDHDDTAEQDLLTPDDVLHQQHKVQQLKQCLEQLPRDQKEAFLLKHEASLTLSEIGHLLSEPNEGIKSRIRYALSKLKHCLSSKIGGNDE